MAEMEPGIPDDTVLDLANREGALLLTADKDFGELVFRLGRLMPGAVLFRLAGLSPASRGEIIAATISGHIRELSRAFTVITPGAVRIRRQTL